MKTCLLVVTLLFIAPSPWASSQQLASVVATVNGPLKVAKKGESYSFSISMESAEADRILDNLPLELPELDSAKRRKSTVTLKFKSGVAPDRIDKTLLYMASIFGNGQFELSE